MSVSAADVKALRDRTNMQMMKCKEALIEAGGDMEKAVELLRKRSKAAQDKAADRPTAEGRIGVFIDDTRKVGAIIEVQCESAPVAKTEKFLALVDDLARQVAEKEASTPEELLAQPFVDDPQRTVHDRIGDDVGLLRENIKPARLTRLEGLLGSYIHHDGSVGVLLQVEGENADPQLLRDVCMHITASNPSVTVREEIPAEVLAKEKEIVQAQMAQDPRNQSKPANILEKIAEGKLQTYFAQHVLAEQPFVKDPSKTVGALLKGAGLTLKQFIRYRVGSESA
jgi:elongation factor Ts